MAAGYPNDLTGTLEGIPYSMWDGPGHPAVSDLDDVFVAQILPYPADQYGGRIHGLAMEPGNGSVHAVGNFFDPGLGSVAFVARTRSM